MNKLFTLLYTLLATAALAAPTPEKHPVDNFQIGVGSTSSQKQFIFDLGLGSSNPTLGVDTVLGGLNYSKNIFQFGDGLSSQKSFIANIGNGTTNPKIVWNASNGDWEFSNDGTNFTSIGSGSGGASGVNLLQNGDFESGITLGWGNTGGTFSSVTSGANLLIGKRSATFLASASGQSVQSSFYLIPNGLTGQACAASMMYKGGDVGLTFQVVDNSSNVLASQVLQNSPSATIVSLPFLCPSSGSVRVKVLSSSSATLIALDQMFLGQNTLIALSQASYVGGVSGNCTFSTSATSLSDMSSTCSSSSLIGSATSFASAGNGSVSFANLPPGEYVATWTGSCSSGNQNSASFIETDGTTTSSEFVTYGGGVGSGPILSPCTIETHFSYLTAGTQTFKMQGAAGAGTINFTNTTPSEFFSLYRYPSQSEQAVRPETINWNVQLANTLGFPILSTGNVSSNTLINGASTSASGASYGSLAALSPCSGTNSPVTPGGTCSSNNASVGVVYSQPAAAAVQVCVNLTVNHTTPANTEYQQTFVIEQTSPVDDSVVLQTSSNVGQNYFQTSTLGETANQNVNVCQIFNIAAAGQTAFRLGYQQQQTTGTASTLDIVQDNSFAGRSTYWSIRPVTQSVPAPVLVGSVIQDSGGVQKIVNTSFSDGAGGTCVSSPCTITYQNTAGITVTRAGAGDYTINFAAGTFSLTPFCTCNCTAAGGITGVSECFAAGAGIAGSPTSIPIECNSSASMPTDSIVNITCMGSK